MGARISYAAFSETRQLQKGAKLVLVDFVLIDLTCKLALRNIRLVPTVVIKKIQSCIKFRIAVPGTMLR
jgi:hypothetical protein